MSSLPIPDHTPDSERSSTPAASAPPHEPPIPPLTAVGFPDDQPDFSDEFIIPVNRQSIFGETPGTSRGAISLHKVAITVGSEEAGGYVALEIDPIDDDFRIEVLSAFRSYGFEIEMNIPEGIPIRFPSQTVLLKVDKESGENSQNLLDRSTTFLLEQRERWIQELDDRIESTTHELFPDTKDSGVGLEKAALGDVQYPELRETNGPTKVDMGRVAQGLQKLGIEQLQEQMWLAAANEENVDRPRGALLDRLIDQVKSTTEPFITNLDEMEAHRPAWYQKLYTGLNQFISAPLELKKPVVEGESRAETMVRTIREATGSFFRIDQSRAKEWEVELFRVVTKFA